MWRVWFICWNLALIGSWLSHILIFVLNSLKWDKSLSVCVLFNSFCLLVLLCSLVELWNQLCVNSILRYNLDSLLLYYTFVCLLVYLVFWSKLYLPFGDWKYCACISNNFISHGMLYFLWSNIEGNSHIPLP